MSLKIDLLTLELFVAVVEERSFAKAAQRKNIAISAVSRRIGDFELAYGVSLLHRRHNGIEPTTAGLSVLAHARGILREVARLDGELHGFATGSHGLIRVFASESTIFGPLPDVLKDFLARYPMVDIEFEEATSPAVVRAIAENLADIGLYVGDIPTDGLETFKFHEDQIAVIVPANHRLAAEQRVQLEQLIDEDFICQEAESAIDRQLFAAAARLGRSVKSRIRVGGFDAACRMVEAGLGIAVTADFISNKLASTMRLAQLELDEPWSTRPHYVCVRRVSALPGAARNLLAHIISVSQ